MTDLPSLFPGQAVDVWHQNKWWPGLCPELPDGSLPTMLDVSVMDLYGAHPVERGDIAEKRLHVPCDDVVPHSIPKVGQIVFATVTREIGISKLSLLQVGDGVSVVTSHPGQRRGTVLRMARDRALVVVQYEHAKLCEAVPATRVRRLTPVDPQAILDGRAALQAAFTPASLIPNTESAA